MFFILRLSLQVQHARLLHQRFLQEVCYNSKEGCLSVSEWFSLVLRNDCGLAVDIFAYSDEMGTSLGGSDAWAIQGILRARGGGSGRSVVLFGSVLPSLVDLHRVLRNSNATMSTLPTVPHSAFFLISVLRGLRHLRWRGKDVVLLLYDGDFPAAANFSRKAAEGSSEFRYPFAVEAWLRAIAYDPVYEKQLQLESWSWESQNWILWLQSKILDFDSPLLLDMLSRHSSQLNTYSLIQSKSSIQGDDASMARRSIYSMRRFYQTGIHPLPPKHTFGNIVGAIFLSLPHSYLTPETLQAVLVSQGERGSQPDLDLYSFVHKSLTGLTLFTEGSEALHDVSAVVNSRMQARHAGENTENRTEKETPSGLWTWVNEDGDSSIRASSASIISGQDKTRPSFSVLESMYASVLLFIRKYCTTWETTFKSFLKYCIQTYEGTPIRDVARHLLRIFPLSITGALEEYIAMVFSFLSSIIIGSTGSGAAHAPLLQRKIDAMTIKVVANEYSYPQGFSMAPVAIPGFRYQHHIPREVYTPTSLSFGSNESFVEDVAWNDPSFDLMHSFKVRNSSRVEYLYNPVERTLTWTGEPVRDEGRGAADELNNHTLSQPFTPSGLDNPRVALVRVGRALEKITRGLTGLDENLHANLPIYFHLTPDLFTGMEEIVITFGAASLPLLLLFAPSLPSFPSILYGTLVISFGVGLFVVPSLFLLLQPRLTASFLDLLEAFLLRSSALVATYAQAAVYHIGTRLPGVIDTITTYTAYSSGHFVSLHALFDAAFHMLPPGCSHLLVWSLFTLILETLYKRIFLPLLTKNSVKNEIAKRDHWMDSWVEFYIQAELDAAIAQSELGTSREFTAMDIKKQKVVSRTTAKGLANETKTTTSESAESLSKLETIQSQNNQTSSSVEASGASTRGSSTANAIRGSTPSKQSSGEERKPKLSKIRRPDLPSVDTSRHPAQDLSISATSASPPLAVSLSSPLAALTSPLPLSLPLGPAVTGPPLAKALETAVATPSPSPSPHPSPLTSPIVQRRLQRIHERYRPSVPTSPLSPLGIARRIAATAPRAVVDATRSAETATHKEASGERDAPAIVKSEIPSVRSVTAGTGAGATLFPQDEESPNVHARLENSLLQHQTTGDGVSLVPPKQLHSTIHSAPRAFLSSPLSTPIAPGTPIHILSTRYAPTNAPMLGRRGTMFVYYILLVTLSYVTVYFQPGLFLLALLPLSTVVVLITVLDYTMSRWYLFASDSPFPTSLIEEIVSPTSRATPSHPLKPSPVLSVSSPLTQDSSVPSRLTNMSERESHQAALNQEGKVLTAGENTEKLPPYPFNLLVAATTSMQVQRASDQLLPPTNALKREVKELDTSLSNGSHMSSWPPNLLRGNMDALWNPFKLPYFPSLPRPSLFIRVSFTRVAPLLSLPKLVLYTLFTYSLSWLLIYATGMKNVSTTEASDLWEKTNVVQSALNRMAAEGFGLLPFEAETLTKQGILPVHTSLQGLFVRYDYKLELQTQHDYTISSLIIRMIFTFSYRMLSFASNLMDEFITYWSFSPFYLGLLVLSIYLLLPIVVRVPSLLLEGEGNWDEDLVSLETKRKIASDIEREKNRLVVPP